VLRRHCDEVGRDYSGIEKTYIRSLLSGSLSRGFPKVLAAS
jgi:hypothetical protein